LEIRDLAPGSDRQQLPVTGLAAYRRVPTPGGQLSVRRPKRADLLRLSQADFHSCSGSSAFATSTPSPAGNHGQLVICLCVISNHAIGKALDVGILQLCASLPSSTSASPAIPAFFEKRLVGLVQRLGSGPSRNLRLGALAWLVCAKAAAPRRRSAVKGAVVVNRWANGFLKSGT
jgi:hypothetical protein